jgi:CRISPR-associated protein Cmr3
MTSFYFVEPIDSLFVRGNLAFGDSGEHGAGVMPPPPSLFAGAFRSAILGRNVGALARFSAQGVAADADLDAALGTLDPKTGEPILTGAFRIAWVTLAGRRAAKGAPLVEPVFPLPADLVKLDAGFAPLTPEAANSLVADGRDLPRVAVLRAPKQTKPEGGVYLSAAGWQSHLAGEIPDAAGALKAADLHTRDPRLGIGLDTEAGTVQSGLIYTTEGHAFSPWHDPARPEQSPKPFAATGFLVGIAGADGLLPETGFLRLGGDGRGARYQRLDYQPPSLPLDTIARTGRFRLILATPGLFPTGWRPPGVIPEGEDQILSVAGCTARLVCAAVPRREVVSGWDLFAWRPKDARRAAPAGSVYWFEGLRGDPRKLADWAAAGLWGDTADPQRRAEGYNLAWLAAWN